MHHFLQAPTRPALRLWAAAALSITTLCLAGCSNTGKFSVVSDANDDVRSSDPFDQAFYAFEDKDTLTAVLFQGDAETPSQAVVIRLFYAPRAGATPISPNATNATIQYMVSDGSAADDEYGNLALYSGAGFLFPENRPGGDTLKASLWQASLQLTAATEGYDDRFGRSTLRGKFTAKRDDAKVSAMVRRLSVLTSSRLGYPRIVAAPPTETVTHTSPTPDARRLKG